MIIAHNAMAVNTINKLNKNIKTSSSSLGRVSSGLRISNSSDDAAGLAISEKMRGQIRGLDMASKNAQDGISLIQTAEGSMDEIHSLVQRMRELTVQGANDTLTDGDRSGIQKELDQLKSEVNNIANNTEFNNIKLLDGSVNKSKSTSNNSSALNPLVKSVSCSKTPNLSIPNNGTIASNTVSIDGHDIKFDFTRIDSDKIGIKASFNGKEIGTKTVQTPAPPDQIIWSKSFGGTDIEIAEDMIKISDGYVFVANSKSSNGDFNQHNVRDVDKGITTVINYSSDGWVVKTDFDGSIKWKTYLGTSDMSKVSSICESNDGGLLVAGYDYGCNYITKLNDQGAVQWTKHTPIMTGANSCLKIHCDSSGNYILTGGTMADTTPGYHKNPTVINSDAYILKLDSNGNTLKEFALGGTGSDFAVNSISTSDGGYILVGHTDSTDGNITHNNGGSDLWVVKLKK